MSETMQVVSNNMVRTDLKPDRTSDTERCSTSSGLTPLCLGQHQAPRAYLLTFIVVVLVQKLSSTDVPCNLAHKSCSPAGHLTGQTDNPTQGLKEVVPEDLPESANLVASCDQSTQCYHTK